MAQMASGNDGSRTYSYTTYKETYTIEEAILKASNGALDPYEIYRQIPPQLKKVIDSFALQVFSKQFSDLPSSQQREIFRMLLSEIEKEKEQRKPLTILDALQMAKEGSIDDLKLYQSLPIEMREVFDTISMSYNALNFIELNPELRKGVLGFITEMLLKSMNEDSKQKSQKEAEQQVLNETKFREEKEAKIQVEKEDKLQNKIELTSIDAKQCKICGKPLGFLDKLRHRRSHQQCLK